MAMDPSRKIGRFWAYVFWSTWPLYLWRAEAHREAARKKEPEWMRKKEQEFKNSLLIKFREVLEKKYGSSS